MPVKLVIVRSHQLKDYYKNCLQNVFTYDLKPIAFCCAGTGICGFDQRKAAEIALAMARLWLNLLTESFFVHMKMRNMKYIKI